MQQRVSHHDFTLACILPTGKVDITFPNEWPGNALAMFPGTLKGLPPDQDEAAGCYPAVHLHTLIAVGQLGVVGPPGPDGIQEIGYGFNPEVWGQRLATESVTALATHLLTWDSVAAVTAKTAASNPTSGRVVEKTEFTASARTGPAMTAIFPLGSSVPSQTQPETVCSELFRLTIRNSQAVRGADLRPLREVPASVLRLNYVVMC